MCKNFLLHQPKDQHLDKKGNIGSPIIIIRGKTTSQEQFTGYQLKELISITK